MTGTLNYEQLATLAIGKRSIARFWLALGRRDKAQYYLMMAREYERAIRNYANSLLTGN